LPFKTLFDTLFTENIYSLTGDFAMISQSAVRQRFLDTKETRGLIVIVPSIPYTPIRREALELVALTITRDFGIMHTVVAIEDCDFIENELRDRHKLLWINDCRNFIVVTTVGIDRDIIKMAEKIFKAKSVFINLFMRDSAVEEIARTAIIQIIRAA
jgi:hypothetical protein